MSRARVDERPNRSRTNLLGRCASRELTLQLRDRKRKKARKRCQGAAVGAPVIEDAEHAGQADAFPGDRVDELGDSSNLMMADDLRQVELGVEIRRPEELRLLTGIGMGIRPAAQRDG